MEYGEPGRQPPRQRPDNGRQQPDSRMPAGVRRWPAENPVAGRALIPRKIISRGDNRHDKNDKSDQCGRWVRINPVSIGLNAAPSHPSDWAEK